MLRSLVFVSLFAGQACVAGEPLFPSRSYDEKPVAKKTQAIDPSLLLKKESAVEEKVSQGSSNNPSVSPANGLAAKPSPPPTVQKKTMHSHKCPSGHVWVHDDHSFADTASHTCPICGKVEFNIHQQNVQVHGVGLTPTDPGKVVQAAKVANPIRIQQTTSNCPGGVCPTTSFSTRRVRRSRR